jgi:hypothetical protein
MRRFACLVVLLLVGCSKSAERVTAVQSPVAAPPVAGPAAQYAWARSDGQRMAGNPDLMRTLTLTSPRVRPRLRPVRPRVFQASPVCVSAATTFVRWIEIGCSRSEP